MKQLLKSAGLAALAAVAAFGQTATTPAFEVASIKPAKPQPGGMVMRRVGGDPGMVNYENVTLRLVLARAYGIKDYQITGPDWLDTESYDIMAKVPEGVPKEQIPAMLQTLLAERFQMVVHKETKTMGVYALTQNKGGIKMKEADPATLVAGNVPDGGRGPNAAPPPPPPGTPVKMTAGPGGTMRINGAAPPPGAVMMMMGPNGRTMRGTMNMGRLSDVLGQNMDKPVVDETGLTGTYEVELTYMPDESDKMAGKMGAMMAQARAAAGDGGGRGDHAENTLDQPVGNLFQALQDKGLKLEQKKAPVEYVVVDKANKVPTEN